jgi:hypothetical protein
MQFLLEKRGQHMKSVLTVAITTAAVITFPLVGIAPAQADTPGCVTEREYLTVYKHETVSSVKDHFDTGGVVVDELWHPAGHDVVRSYRKCEGFDKGRGRVGVNYDDYSHESAGYTDSKLRLWRKARSNPYRLVWWW